MDEARLTDEHGHLADAKGDAEGPDRFSVGGLDLKRLQEGDDPVLGNGLKYS